MSARYPIHPNEVTPERRHRTAVHEAGHALTAYLLGMSFEYVTIQPRDDAHPDALDDSGDLGHVRRRVRFGELDRLRKWERGVAFVPEIDAGAADSRPLHDLWPLYREQAEEEILYSLAGYAAEWLHFDSADEEEDEYDLLDEQANDNGDGTKAAQIARAFTVDEQEADAYISLLRYRARNLLDLPGCRRAVELLAAALVQTDSIAQAEAVKIFQDAFDEEEEQDGEPPAA